MSDTQRVRAHTHSGCRSIDLAKSDRSLRFPKLTASVGRYGVNKSADTVAVQTALNAIPAELGGPFPALAVDGDAKTLTIGAIEKFQRFHFPERYTDKNPDGRIDVDQWTITRLKDMYELIERLGRIAAVPFWIVRRPIRLARARLGTGDAASAVSDALGRLDAAVKALRDGAAHTNRERDSLRLVLFYFRLAGTKVSEVMTAVMRIRLTFQRVQTTLNKRGRTFGLYTGGDIFQIDPHNKPYIAYSPTQTGYEAGTDPNYIYLGQGCDNISTDFFNHMLVHELLHMTDIETPGEEIVDKGYRADALKLSHNDTLHNADSFAMFATHAHIGRTRMVASQLGLAPVIPADLP